MLEVMTAALLVATVALAGLVALFTAVLCIVATVSLWDDLGGDE